MQEVEGMAGYSSILDRMLISSAINFDGHTVDEHIYPFFFSFFLTKKQTLCEISKK